MHSHHDNVSRRAFLGAAAAGAVAYVIGSGALPSRLPGAWAAGASGSVDRTRWPELAHIALARVRTGGCTYGDIRLMDTHSQSIWAEDRRIAHVAERFDSGY